MPLLVPNQALRWQPTWDADYALGSGRPEAAQPTAGGSEEQGDDASGSTEPKVVTGTPTVWMIADDGLGAARSP